MTFKNEKELERFILKKSRLALMKAQEQVYKILKDLVKRITELDYKIKSGLIDKKLGFQLFLLGV